MIHKSKHYMLYNLKGSLAVDWLCASNIKVYGECALLLGLIGVSLKAITYVLFSLLKRAFQPLMF